MGQGKEGQQEAPPTQLWDPWEGKGSWHWGLSQDWGSQQR